MVQAELTITNEQGIHLGPANKIANLADRYDCQIHFKTDYMDVNAKSIINLISGTFRHGMLYSVFVMDQMKKKH